MQKYPFQKRMKKLLSHPFIRTHLSQGIKFMIAGGIGTAIDLLALTLIMQLLDVGPAYVFFVSSALGASFVFIANKFITFGSQGSTKHEAFKFAMVYGVAIALNGAFSNLFHRFGVHVLLSKILAIGVIAIWNYSLSHGFVFHKKDRVEPVVF